MRNIFKMAWLFNKQVRSALLWTILLIVIAALINLIGIRIAGDIEHWNIWLKDHAAIFLIWRVILYSVISYGWFWMRKRVIQREPMAKTRIIRAEIFAIGALLLLEISHLSI